MRTFCITVLLLAAAGTAKAQLVTPPEWRWSLDAPARLVTEQAVPDSAWRFVAMPPGWHVTTGPGAFLYDPAHTADGVFTLTSTLYLFPDPSESGYGLFLGAESYDGERPLGLSFLLRRDGAATVTRTDSTGTETVVPWTTVPAARPHTGGVVENRLAVAAGPDRIAFRVNDDTVAVLPRTSYAVDGGFGFRVGSGVNLHAGSLDLTRHLAPPRRETP